jgi:uncharacterized membrane protein YebE (DUF533 family)
MNETTNETSPQKVNSIDYTVLADTMDELRDALKAMVAGFTADGFTDREARAIVAGTFASMTRPDTEDTGDTGDTP